MTQEDSKHVAHVSMVVDIPKTVVLDCYI